MTHILLGFGETIQERRSVKLYWVHTVWAVNVSRLSQHEGPGCYTILLYLLAVIICPKQIWLSVDLYYNYNATALGALGDLFNR